MRKTEVRWVSVRAWSGWTLRVRCTRGAHEEALWSRGWHRGVSIARAQQEPPDGRRGAFRTAL